MNRVGRGRNAVWGGCEESLINSHFQSVRAAMLRRTDRPAGACPIRGDRLDFFCVTTVFPLEKIGPPKLKLKLKLKLYSDPGCRRYDPL